LDSKVFIQKIREAADLPLNKVYVIENTGDIMYFVGGGLIPMRKYNVV
jgi:hypothetical protein